jgi:outer membrane protein OmpA-like peptidoglycan-associated protein
MQLFAAPVGRYIAFAFVLATASAIAVLVESPPRGRVVVTETTTEILDVVEFEPGTATLRTTAFPILDAVAATMLGNPSIELVEVQSHTSGVGDEGANLTLTEQRAAAVEAYLVGAGVESARLDAQGYGDTQPLDHAGSFKNERISFLILRRTSDHEVYK